MATTINPVEPFTFVERSFTGYIVAFPPNGRAEPETSYGDDECKTGEDKVESGC